MMNYLVTVFSENYQGKEVYEQVVYCTKINTKLFLKNDDNEAKTWYYNYTR